MAYGDIGTAKTPVTVRTGVCQNPRVIRVGPGAFAVFYYDSVHNICVKTYLSDDDGNITGVSTTDTVVDAAGLTDIRLIHVAGTVYAVIYYGASNVGRLTTVDIAEDGTINDANIASLTWQNDPIYKPHICHVNGDIYAITYWRNPPSSGRLRTISISQNGATLGNLDDWEFEAAQIYFSCCIYLSDGYVLVAYQNWTNVLVMFSVAIDLVGDITQSLITEWDTGVQGTAPWLIRVAPQQYAVTVAGLGADGYVQSCAVAYTGEITHSWTDQLEFDTDNIGVNQIVSLGGIYYAVHFLDVLSHWRLATFEITAQGSISNSNIDTYDHDQITESYPSWCWVTANIYVCAWEDDYDDVIITPIDIESFAPPSTGQHEMMMAIGP